MTVPSQFKPVYLVLAANVLLFSCRDQAREQQLTDQIDDLTAENHKLKERLSNLQEEVDDMQQARARETAKIAYQNSETYVLVRFVYDPPGPYHIDAAITEVITALDLNQESKYRIMDNEERKFLLANPGSFVRKREFYRFNTYAAASEARIKSRAYVFEELRAYYDHKPLPEHKGAE